MDETVFDAMLKTALEEALRRDAGEAPEARPSRRQERRMRRLLADPRRGAAPETAAARQHRWPARWLAAAIIAALLGGAAAAGAILGSGEWFRSMFENSDSAGYYGGAADTEQLTGMGAAIDTPVVERDGLRFEILDAIFDGQTAMLNLRMTVLDIALTERLREDGPQFWTMELLREDSERPMSWGYSSRSWEMSKELKEGEYTLIFSITGEDLNAGGRYGIRFGDLTYYNHERGKEEVLLPGEWTLSVTLQPTDLVELEPKRICQIDGVDWMLDSVTLSPLALRFSLHCLVQERQDYRDVSEGLEIHMKDGTVVDRRGCASGTSGNGHTAAAQLDFPMPLDLEQVDFLRICGQDIRLEG